VSTLTAQEKQMLRYKKQVLALLAVTAGAWLLASGGAAREPARPATNPAAKVSATLEMIQEQSMACCLIDEVRQNRCKSPFALIAAAQLLAKAPAKEMQEKGSALAAELKKAGCIQLKDTPQTLLADARGMTDSPSVHALIDQVSKTVAERPRGREGTPFLAMFDMAPRATFAMKIPFRGKEQGLIAAKCMDGGDLRLTISDPVAGWEKSDQGPVVRVQWLQQEAGEVLMRRENLTDRHIRVFVWTN